MNERIKQLASQAGFVSGIWAPDNVAAINCKTELEKFAELIVRECISVHEDNYGIDIIGDVLKKHFGVEE